MRLLGYGTVFRTRSEQQSLILSFGGCCIPGLAPDANAPHVRSNVCTLIDVCFVLFCLFFFMLRFPVLYSFLCFGFQFCILFYASVSSFVFFFMLRFPVLYSFLCFGFQFCILFYASVSSFVFFFMLRFPVLYSFLCFGFQFCILFYASVSSFVFFFMLRFPVWYSFLCFSFLFCFILFCSCFISNFLVLHILSFLCIALT